MTINHTSGRILAAVFAVLATAALHTTWLNALDRDAIAATSTVTA